MRGHRGSIHNEMKFMKPIEMFLFIAWNSLAALSASAQGTFQNLDFEQAYPVFIHGSEYNDATAVSALPYWTATIGGVQQNEIPVNDPSTGAPWVSLLGPGNPQFGFVPSNPIDANYSVLLQGTFESAAISQTGLIPAGTQSLLFKTQSTPAQNGPLDFLVGNQSVPLVQVGTGPNYIVYGANLSAWSGQTEELTFLAPSGNVLDNWEIDDISFSPTAVTPEPSPLALTGIGALLFALYRRLAPRHP